MCGRASPRTSRTRIVACRSDQTSWAGAFHAVSLLQFSVLFSFISNMRPGLKLQSYDRFAPFPRINRTRRTTHLPVLCLQTMLKLLPLLLLLLLL